MVCIEEIGRNPVLCWSPLCSSSYQTLQWSPGALGNKPSTPCSNRHEFFGVNNKNAVKRHVFFQCLLKHWVFCCKDSVGPISKPCGQFPGVDRRWIGSSFTNIFGRFFEELLNYMEDIRDVRASSTKLCQENTRVSSGRIWEVPRFQNPFYLQARKQ